jgi:hypothetical protein
MATSAAGSGNTAIASAFSTFRVEGSGFGIWDLVLSVESV